MPKWEINVTKTSELTLLVNAATYEEALAIYDSAEDHLEDYECTNEEVRLDLIVKIGEDLTCLNVNCDKVTRWTTYEAQQALCDDCDAVKPTYHGITKAICLNCGKITQDTTALEILNDLDPICTGCSVHAIAWHTAQDITVTAQADPDQDTTRHTIKLTKGNK
jgi:hypothetical protein